jgi:DNA-binding CsgD family transcriptional regulator
MNWGKGHVMVAPVTVSEKDLHTLLGIVHDDRSDLPEAGLPLSLLAELKDQISCDALSFFGMDSDRQTTWFGQDVPVDCPDEEPYELGFWEHFWHFDPCTYPQRSGDVRSVTKISDFYSARQLHRTGMYSDYLQPLGIEHDIRVCLADGPGRIAGPGRSVDLGLFRGPGPDFSERDRALLALLRPHLQEAYLAAERRRSAKPQLTPRQQELLRLVAVGHTNAQIARRLGVSEGTVRIHLQNIYARLQVSSRTAAVTHAFPELAAV